MKRKNLVETIKTSFISQSSCAFFTPLPLLPVIPQIKYFSSHQNWLRWRAKEVKICILCQTFGCFRVKFFLSLTLSLSFSLSFPHCWQNFFETFWSTCCCYTMTSFFLWSNGIHFEHSIRKIRLPKRRTLRVRFPKTHLFILYTGQQQSYWEFHRFRGRYNWPYFQLIKWK